MQEEQLFSVKLTSSRAGNGVAHEKGDVIDVPLARAHRLITAGQAKYVGEGKLPPYTPPAPVHVPGPAAPENDEDDSDADDGGEEIANTEGKSKLRSRKAAK
ncbi:hypothetical protein Plim_4254 (plasmid) [Planctopirus limnophila DSM 3776]|uniref:Uncharacterized protein n=1 Tax=Planctopirus limnophila (strain ATCC 43296 / DSM 3776 / IFAM 1008 / Mu 290) TaxID=521674 RepID=D5SZE1_PLAL2|nr:hypothetical protein [Planctopirus limnophila]ADG70061.1 hypothetical protein Plim_4254 [Planctopirus limnophila DSM 3776]